MAKAQRQLVLGGVAVVALAVAGIFLYGQSGPAAGTTPSAISVNGVCLGCKTEGTWKFPLVESPPHTCPNCNSATIYPWLFCSDCNHKFVPRPEGSAARMPAVAICPKCRRSTAVAAFIPEACTPEGQATVPVWP